MGEEIKQKMREITLPPPQPELTSVAQVESRTNQPPVESNDSAAVITGNTGVPEVKQTTDCC